MLSFDRAIGRRPHNRRRTLHDVVSIERVLYPKARNRWTRRYRTLTDEVRAAVRDIDSLPSYTAEARMELARWFERIGVVVELPPPRDWTPSKLRSHSYRPAGRAKSDQCGRGHDLTVPNARLGKSKRCRVCHYRQCQLRRVTGERLRVTCTRGHDLTKPGARFSSRQRCRRCHAIHMRELRARKRLTSQHAHATRFSLPNE